MEGKGAWFETEDAARAYVFKHFKRGARSFDVGCFQINYKWHGQAFASIDEMFDPLENAIYAARYLRDLYQEFGDWSAAAGAYHSRTPEYAKKYRARFDRHLARVADEPLQASPLNAPLTRATDQPARHNSYPLLQSTGGRVVLGSLVPLVDTGDDSHAESGLFADRPGWGS